MIVTLGYFIFFLLRSWRQRYRRNMIQGAIKKVLQRSSVYVQRTSARTTDSCAGSLIRSALVNGSVQFQEASLLDVDHMLLTSITPIQMINLKDWTAYYKSRSDLPLSYSITMLMETSRPADINQFLQRQLDIPAGDRVPVSSCGSLMAWHSGTPFGILLRCSPESLATLILAYVDGALIMNEDLEVLTLMTVQTEGTSSVLYQPPGSMTDSNVASPRMDNGDGKNMEQLLASAIGEAQDQMAEEWSNESLASNSSIGRVDMLEMSDNDILEGDFYMDESINESGSGEGLSEFNMEDSSSTASGSLSQSWKVVQSTSLVKPPNILIYSGKVDSVRKFELVRKVLEQCIDNECYVIYHLKHEDLETTPWTDNTSLLVLASTKRYEDAGRAFLNFFKSGGKIMALGSGFDSVLIGQTLVRSENWMTQLTYKTWTDVALVSGMYTYNLSEVKLDGCRATALATDKEHNVAIVKVTMETKGLSGCAILSQVLFDKDAGYLGVTPEIFNTLKKSNTARFEILQHLLTSLGLECNPQSAPTLTPAVLLCPSEILKTNFLKSIQSRLSSGVLKFGGQSLHFCMESGVPVESNLLPVITEKTEPVCVNFNQARYFENLGSRVLGNTVIYADVVPTTMTLLDGLMFSVPEETGLIAIARQQTSGKGRGGNSWLSPVGCAMFTLHVRVPLDSALGRCVSYLQHITSLAVVYSVCKMEGYQDVDLKLKWPNDIYYGRQMKLGGVIVKSTIVDGMVHATIGCGFNVDNSNPTICINDLIQLLNRQRGTTLAPCTTEQLLARTVSHIEALIDQFQKEGVERFRQLYYEKWLHSHSKVTLQSEGNMEVTVLGLDEYGYLLVESPTGSKISVQPDGNSFDMMQNLITMKAR